MKTPEQAGYPTPKKTLEKNLKLISDSIDKGEYIIDSLNYPYDIPDLNKELRKFGWKIIHCDGRYNESHFELKPLQS